MDDPSVRAMAFATIVFGNLALLFSMRSRRRTVLQTIRAPNAALWWITAGALGALAAAIYVPALASLFRFSPLDVGDMAVALAAGLAGVIWFEALKSRTAAEAVKRRTVRES